LYLQHSDWANDVYKPYFGRRCRCWPAGIDTDAWRPASAAPIRHDFLIYDKIMWDRPSRALELLAPVERELARRKLSFRTLRYGSYTESQFRNLLATCRAMIFLCEHESQGLAYLEALASGVPILAWDQGLCLDPCRFGWGEPNIKATSVPFFDGRCGDTFATIAEFSAALDRFLAALTRKRFAPRDFVLESLTLEKCSGAFLGLLEEAQG
ncbi:MAG: glycosyltransferase, partial [Rhizomicrobium sp.]